MAYDRYPRGDYNRSGNGDMDYGRDYGSGRDYTYSSARDYAAADSGQGRDRNDRGGRYGSRDYGYERYGQREQFNRGTQYGAQYNDRGYSQRDSGREGYGRSGYGQDQGSEYHGSYAHDGRRFEDVGRYRHADDDNYRGRQASQGQRGYGRQPQGYDYEERGFFQRAGDEVRSWFGDDEAERRREQDARYDERYYSGSRHDDDYHGWRSSQVAAFDRDYDEYRRENRTKFEKEFSAWRTTRQGQRDQLKKVTEHQEVVGSDGSHVGTVDKVRGDRIILTKNDADAGGRHHSIPSNWISSVDDKVTLSKTASEAKSAWQDEERNSAMFGEGDQNSQTRQTSGSTAQGQSDANSTSGTNLNRSFSGTY